MILLATIRDVARLAGVSISTVSHLLNGTARVSPGTRDKILKAMKQLNYYPDSRARKLAKGKANTVAVVFLPNPGRSLADPIYLDFISSIGDEINAGGYNVLLYNPRSYDDQMQKVIELSRGKEVDGILLVGNTDPDPCIEYLLEHRFPFVVIGRAPEAHWIYSDNLGGARQATQHLINLGHERICCIAGLLAMVGGHDRLQGYLQAMEDAKIDVKEAWIRSGDFTERGGYQAMQELLATGDFTAVYCAGDVMASGALRAIRERGLRVPEDIALVSFDNFSMAAYLNPPLTTVRQDTQGLGSKAARLLLEEISEPKEKPVQIMLPTELIVRKSCGMLLTHRT